MRENWNIGRRLVPRAFTEWIKLIRRYVIVRLLFVQVSLFVQLSIGRLSPPSMQLELAIQVGKGVRMDETDHSNILFASPPCIFVFSCRTNSAIDNVVITAINS
jgi:hypothetical protein